MLLRKKSLYSQIISVCGYAVRCQFDRTPDTRRRKVRNFSGDSALPPTLKSVQNRCEILKISELKNRLEKRTLGGFKNIRNFLIVNFEKINFEISS